MIEFEVTDPLARCVGETKLANLALRDYYAMSAGRSLRSLFSEYRKQSSNDTQARPPTNRLSTINTWSTIYSWQERVAVQEEIDRKKVEEAREKALKDEAEKWAQRRITVRERDWGQAESVRALVDDILKAAPRFIRRKERTRRGHDGEPDTIIITESLDVSLMVNALKTSSQLQRLAAEMETEHAINEVTSPEELERIREKRWQAIAPLLAELPGQDIDGVPDADTDTEETVIEEPETDDETGDLDDLVEEENE